MKKLILFLLSFTLLLSSTIICSSAQDPTDKNMKYKVGQSYSYDARPGEEKSFLVIVKIDEDPKLGKIIHIALRGLKVKNRRSPDGLSENVEHLPFALEAIEKSGLKLLEEKTDLPDYKEGYRLWREAFESGRGGVYSITIAEAVDVIEQGLNR